MRHFDPRETGFRLYPLVEKMQVEFKVMLAWRESGGVYEDARSILIDELDNLYEEMTHNLSVRVEDGECTGCGGTHEGDPVTLDACSYIMHDLNLTHMAVAHLDFQRSILSYMADDAVPVTWLAELQAWASNSGDWFAARAALEDAPRESDVDIAQQLSEIFGVDITEFLSDDEDEDDDDAS